MTASIFLFSLKKNVWLTYCRILLVFPNYSENQKNILPFPLHWLYFKYFQEIYESDSEVVRGHEKNKIAHSTIKPIIATLWKPNKLKIIIAGRVVLYVYSKLIITNGDRNFYDFFFMYVLLFLSTENSRGGGTRKRPRWRPPPSTLR